MDGEESALAVETLRASDEVLAELIDGLGSPEEIMRRRGLAPADAYGALVRAIVGQQLSSKAARTIYTRLTDLFGGRTPLPAELIATDPAALRAAGLSGRKVEYLRDLAARVEGRELDLDGLAALPDEEVAAQLVAVKGLGRWSADMFLIFHLGRPDVLPVGDLGIRRAAMVAYDLESLPDSETLERLAERWRPYRSLACLYLWRSLANEPA